MSKREQRRLLSKAVIVLSIGIISPTLAAIIVAAMAVKYLFDDGNLS